MPEHAGGDADAGSTEPEEVLAHPEREIQTLNERTKAQAVEPRRRPAFP